MPSTSPGSRAPTTSLFGQIFPGAPAASLQSFATFTYRFKRYVAYLSGRTLNILSGPNALVQAVTFDHPLRALAAEKETGKLAVAGKSHVYILHPVTEGWTKIWWEQTLSLRCEDAQNEAHRLSWGNEGEVMVGGSRSLSLYSTLLSSRTNAPESSPVGPELVEERRSLWSKPVSSPILFAEFSPSASIIASCAYYDRLVKIWRRLSYEEGSFDFAYLPHPGAVTHIQWRPLTQQLDERRSSGLSGRHDDDPEVLYTIANDGVLRIWRTGAMHDLEIMLSHASIDLVTAIPQSPTLTNNGIVPAVRPPRYAFVIPSDHFCRAVDSAAGISRDGKVNHSLEHLKETATKGPDVIVAIDGHGRMSAWGLQSIGHKRRPETPTATQAFHIAHAEDLPFQFPSSSPATFEAWFQDDEIHLLTHTVGQRSGIRWWNGSIENFLSPAAPGTRRLTQMSSWGGHDEQVSVLQSSDESFVTWSPHQVCLWTNASLYSWACTLSFAADAGILAASWISNIDAVLVVHTNGARLYDRDGSCSAETAYGTIEAGTILSSSSDDKIIRGLYVQNDGRALMWTITYSGLRDGSRKAEVKLVKVSSYERLGPKVPSCAVPVHDISTRSLGRIVHVDEKGVLNSTVIYHSSERSATTVATTYETGLSNATILAANEDMAAIVSISGKTIMLVDLSTGYVEHQFSTENPVTHAAFLKSIITAIGWDTRIDILVRCRYAPHSANEPIWTPVRTVSIAEMGLSISTMGWIDDGSLAIAAGNVILTVPPEMVCADLPAGLQEILSLEVGSAGVVNLVQLSQLLNLPLPAWHPTQLSSLVETGRFRLAVSLINALARKLKFWSSGEHLDPMLGVSVDGALDDETPEDDELDLDLVQDLRELLSEKDLPAISRSEQQRLIMLVEAIVYLREHENGLDLNAVRYLLGWKLQLLDGQRHEEPEMSWREIAFAHKSTTQQTLLDILVLHHDNKLTWPTARRLGIMAWLTEREALEQVFDQLAQSAYRSSSPPDPVHASLYFLALHKKTTLLGLWRIATWHKEQKSTLNFLKRDFSLPDARTAARKNAYALMGKRRFAYAAAFFLLADDPASATSLLAGQGEDPQLAVAVARLYCGGGGGNDDDDGSPALRKLLNDRLLPAARQRGDRWLLTWCHSLLRENPEAALALVQPHAAGVQTWRQDDPDVMLLYEQLRTTTSSSAAAAAAVAEEYHAVLRSARVLRRMGLWLAALQLVRRWKFQPAPTTATDDRATNGVRNGVHEHPRASLVQDGAFASASPAATEAPASMLDSVPAPDAVPQGAARADEKSTREAKAAELLKILRAKKDSPSVGVVPGTKAKGKQQQPTQFKEPDANSLLDNFGF